MDNNVKHQIDILQHTFNIDLSSYKEKELIIKAFDKKKMDIREFDMNNSEHLNIIGMYYKYIEKNFEEAKKYFLLALEKDNCVHSLINIGLINEGIAILNQSGDYSDAIKYLLLAVDKGSVYAMYNLGRIYHNIKQTNNMIKYYAMASENGNVKSSFRLAT